MHGLGCCGILRYLNTVAQISCTARRARDLGGSGQAVIHVHGCAKITRMREPGCVQGTRQALEVQVRALEERLRKQRGARQQVEEHLKGLFRDFQAARGDADALRQRCADSDGEKAELQGRLHECERRLISLQVRCPARLFWYGAIEVLSSGGAPTAWPWPSSIVLSSRCPVRSSGWRSDQHFPPAGARWSSPEPLDRPETLTMHVWQGLRH